MYMEDEMEKQCPTCGAELTGISETFSADGKKISTDNYSYGISYVNQKEHKFALKEEVEVKEEEHEIEMIKLGEMVVRWPNYTFVELKKEALADYAEKFKIKDE
jgi:hypothetical protein